MFPQQNKHGQVSMVSTFPALTTYCSTVLGSLMIDLGKARMAETNFLIAR